MIGFCGTAKRPSLNAPGCYINTTRPKRGENGNCCRRTRQKGQEFSLGGEQSAATDNVFGRTSGIPPISTPTVLCRHLVLINIHTESHGFDAVTNLERDREVRFEEVLHEDRPRSSEKILFWQARDHRREVQSWIVRGLYHHWDVPDSSLAQRK